MDRSFLSRPEVIQASRKFVCIRLTTYENETEAKFSKLLLRTRSGDVENTTFGLLAPDGQTKLSRMGRGAQQVFVDAAEMAKAMTEVATRYPAKGDPATLPVTLDARLGVNVAASDGQPLVLVLAADEKTRAALSETVAKLAWDREFIGHFVYAAAAAAEELKKVEGMKSDDGIIVIEPSTFGVGGKVVKQLPADAKPTVIAEALRATLAAHKATAKTMRDHRIAGIAAGAFWIPKLPVTDRQEEAAREGTKRAIEQKK